jgi:hypothetical protein
MIFDEKLVRNYGDASIGKVRIPTNRGDDFQKQVTNSKNKVIFWEKV